MLLLNEWTSEALEGVGCPRPHTEMRSSTAQWQEADGESHTRTGVCLLPEAKVQLQCSQHPLFKAWGPGAPFRRIYRPKYLNVSFSTQWCACPSAARKIHGRKISYSLEMTEVPHLAGKNPGSRASIWALPLGCVSLGKWKSSYSLSLPICKVGTVPT